MPSKINIALDCMGGDRAPQIVIEGAELFLNNSASSNTEYHFNLFGDAAKINPILIRCPNLKTSSSVIHTNQFVKAEDKPSDALRRATNSSMRLAIDSVKDLSSDVVVSAGNTGALMAISKVILRPLLGIERPAIVTSIPNSKNSSEDGNGLSISQGSGTIFLDMGANLECSANVLYQFAIMGFAFAKIVNNVAEPKIGVLNVGSEDSKGSEQLQEVAKMLKSGHLRSNFYGYVEGDDITKGTVDVVVTDGFSGNITLKAIEGTAKMISHFIKKGFLSSFFAKLGYLFAGQAIKKATANLDPRMHNGAMLIGLNGVVVKSHGGTDEIGFANAIKVATSLVEKKINQQIIDELNAIKNKDIEVF